MTQTMRAVDIHNSAGPPHSLHLNPSIPRPTPSASECLIRVRAFGLNRADTLQREGKYPVPPGVTKILGLEFSGVVEEVGAGSDGKGQSEVAGEGANAGDGQGHTWKKGDEVFGLTYGGAYAEYVAVDKRMLIHKPAHLSWEYTGGLCEVWFTALQALYLVGALDEEVGGKELGDKSVLWHAGGSGVSIAGVQLCKAAAEGKGGKASKVYVTARQDSKLQFCGEVLGADGGVNTRTHNDDWAEEVRKLNGGQGVDLLIDFVGADTFQGNLEVMNLDGRIVQLGTMSGTKLKEVTDIGAFVRKRVRFEGSTLRSRKPEYQRKLRDLFVEKVLPHLVEGKEQSEEAKKEGKMPFENHIDTVMSWTKIKEAHEKLERNETTGKVICVVD